MTLATFSKNGAQSIQNPVYAIPAEEHSTRPHLHVRSGGQVATQIQVLAFIHRAVSINAPLPPMSNASKLEQKAR